MHFSLLGAYLNIREFYVCVCPSLRFGFIIYLIMGRLCVILYAIYVSLSLQELSDGSGLNAIEYLNISIFWCFKTFFLQFYGHVSLVLLRSQNLNNYSVSLIQWHNVGLS